MRRILYMSLNMASSSLLVVSTCSRLKQRSAYGFYVVETELIVLLQGCRKHLEHGKYSAQAAESGMCHLGSTAV